MKTKMSRNAVISLFSLLVGLVYVGGSLAYDYNLPPLTTATCVGKKGRLMGFKIQVEDWFVNGKTNPRHSTWHYDGKFSTVTLDYATADAIADCKKVGVDTYDIVAVVNTPNRDKYTVAFTVQCIDCLPPRIPTGGAAATLRDLKKAVKAAQWALENSRLSEVESSLEKMRWLLRKEMDTDSDAKILYSKVNVALNAFKKENLSLLRMSLQEIEAFMKQEESLNRVDHE